MIEPDRDGDITRMRKLEEFWKAFFKRAAHPFRIPNEMADAKRCELLAGIPGSEAGNASITFVLPDSFTDPKCVSARDLGRGGAMGGNDRQQG